MTASQNDNAKERACNLLTEHRDQLDLITNELIEKETLDDADIRKLLKIEEVAAK